MERVTFIKKYYLSFFMNQYHHYNNVNIYKNTNTLYSSNLSLEFAKSHLILEVLMLLILSLM